MKKGKAVIGIFLAIWLLVIAGILLSKHLDKKHGEKLIQMVQDAELGDGVTLQQAVQAYFSEPGSWMAFDDTVHLSVGAFSDWHTLSATFQINEKTGQLDITRFYYDSYDLSRNERESIINDMIRAAKR